MILLVLMFILTKVVHRDQILIHEMFPVPSPNSCTDLLEAPFPTKETNMLEGNNNNNNKTSMCLESCKLERKEREKSKKGL